MPRPPRLTWLLLLASIGCGSPPPSGDAGDDASAACSGPGRVEVGRGGSRPMALADGDAVPIVLGSQGGIHVVVAAWVDDLGLDLTLVYRLTDDDGETLGEPTRVDLRPSLFMPAGTRHVRHPDLVVLDAEQPSVEAFAGREVTLSVEATSEDGAHACDSRRVVLLAP